MHTPLLKDAPRILIHVRGLMNPYDTDFWQSLRYSLNKKNYELLLITYNMPKHPCDLPFLKCLSGLDGASVMKVSFNEGWNSWLPFSKDLDEDELLERESFWRGKEYSVYHLERRRWGLYFYKNFYTTVLQAVKPVLTVIWNCQHPQEMIFERLARKCGCPVLFLERGPFFGTLHFDSEGILGGTSVANQIKQGWEIKENPEYWTKAFLKIKDDYQKKKRTWWNQPGTIGPEKLRKKLRIKPNSKVLLFAGQVDEDVQNLFYSPNFKDNLSAFKWLYDNLEDKENIFILGKHHPMSKKSPNIYNDIIKKNGIWTDKASLEDCLALADRIAAVNSTVLYEALLMDKPILSMGKSLLFGKGIAYEINDLDKDKKIIDDWLEAKDFDLKKERFLNFGAYLFSSVFFSMDSSEKDFKLRGADELAQHLIENTVHQKNLNYNSILMDMTIFDKMLFFDNNLNKFSSETFYLIKRRIKRFIGNTLKSLKLR